MVAKLHFRLIFLFIFLLAFFSYSETIMKNLNLSIKDALKAYEDDNLIVVDIRTEKEWKETGIIPNSILVSMHNNNYEENSNFVEQITTILDKHFKENIVFICASGARSEIVTNYFFKKGYQNVSHIPEGIIGKNKDGWLFLCYPIKALNLD